MKGAWRPTRPATIVLAIIAFAALAAPVLAEQTKFHVRPTLKLNRSTGEDQFKGKLRSKEHACEANRKIKLHHRNVTQQAKSGRDREAAHERQGQVEVPRRRRTTTATATRPRATTRSEIGEKKVSTGDGEIVCRKKNSSSLLVG